MDVYLVQVYVNAGNRILTNGTVVVSGLMDVGEVAKQRWNGCPNST